MTHATDKERADAAEAKLAEIVTRNFERVMAEIMADKTSSLNARAAKMLRSLADLLDSGVPFSVLRPFLERVFPDPQPRDTDGTRAPNE